MPKCGSADGFWRGWSGSPSSPPRFLGWRWRWRWRSSSCGRSRGGRTVVDELRSTCTKLYEKRQQLTPRDVEQVEAVLLSSARELVETRQFVDTNWIGFCKITKKFDKYAKVRIGGWFLARVERESFVTAPIFGVALALAVAFKQLRKVKGGSDRGG
mmetsp:Transcript_317/g.869  ORF Transcript_317/g.869 Transcript_317/m.869 type:complete len:157 (+) Transcript_317:189-659(+)